MRRCLAHLAKFVADRQIDVIIFDPLQDMSHADETNEAFRLLGQRLSRFASESKVAIGLVHHTRKVAAGMSATIDDARGGSALRGTSRFNRVLVPMRRPRPPRPVWTIRASTSASVMSRATSRHRPAPATNGIASWASDCRTVSQWD